MYSEFESICFILPENVHFLICTVTKKFTSLYFSKQFNVIILYNLASSDFPTKINCLSIIPLVLNQLPLPSPLPATTAKSLLYNGRISEEVSNLLVCRDENLVTQLAHSLNQVSTEHM